MIPFCSEEFHISNCGFHIDRVDAFVRSQWQEKSKSSNFLIYRWIVGIFFFYVFVHVTVTNLNKYPISDFFFYFTYWGVVLNMVFGVMSVALVTTWHFNKDFEDQISKSDEMPTSFKIYWALHNIALIVSIVITILFWSLRHPGNDIEWPYENVLMHGTNAAFMFIDILVVAHPMRLYHVIQPLAFMVSFVIFSYIYNLCGGRDSMGNHYIYELLDWSKPKRAIMYIFGTLFLDIIIYFLLFWITKLRMFIRKRSLQSETVLPTPSWTTIYE